MDVIEDGKTVGQLEPEIRMYKASQQQNSMVGIRRRLNEDLYVNYSGVLPDGRKATFQFYQFPLVSCIWLGYWVLLFGTLICLIPSKVRLQYARTEVVSVASVPQTVKS
jgi:cytochrome c-type biogenesis protein CcmF